jgi:hypothetical protein
LPTILSVDCASRQNFVTFQKYPEYLGLAGVVSMARVRGSLGSYAAANLFLFPWLNQKGLALGPSKVWPAVVPTSATGMKPASPIPGYSAVEEHFCRYVIEAPASQFIGFVVQTPFDAGRARMVQFTNLDRLSLGINWTSSNLNAPYFAGSRMIPATDQCNGKAWRELIMAGLTKASAGAC